MTTAYEKDPFPSSPPPPREPTALDRAARQYAENADVALEIERCVRRHLSPPPARPKK